MVMVVVWVLLVVVWIVLRWLFWHQHQQRLGLLFLKNRAAQSRQQGRTDGETRWRGRAGADRGGQAAPASGASDRTGAAGARRCTGRGDRRTLCC